MVPRNSRYLLPSRNIPGDLGEILLLIIRLWSSDFGLYHSSPLLLKEAVSFEPLRLNEEALLKRCQYVRTHACTCTYMHTEL